MAKVALLIGVTTNLAVKEGYNIQLVKAPIGDPKLEYHNVIRQYGSGKTKTLSRTTL